MKAFVIDRDTPADGRHLAEVDNPLDDGSQVRSRSMRRVNQLDAKSA